MSDLYYDDEDEIDVRFRRGGSHRGSPVYPVAYPENHYRPVARPAYYGGPYLAAEVGGSHRRSRSHSGSGHSHASPPAPVIINKIYNEHDSEEEDRYQLAPPRHSRSRSGSVSRHSRSNSRPSSAYYSRDDWDREDRLEQTTRELERFKMREEAERKEKLLHKEMELKKLKEEKRAKEEEERLKKEKAWAVERYKLEEAEKAHKAKKEKEERERDYQKRFEADMRRMGHDDREIARLSNQRTMGDVGRPTYTRMARRYLSIETLNAFRIDFQYDQDPDYVLIKRVVPQWEQDRLWQHTKHVREQARESKQPVYIAIEDRHKHHHHEPELEFVREKKKHERKASPSPLLTWVAGGKK